MLLSFRHGDSPDRVISIIHLMVIEYLFRDGDPPFMIVFDVINLQNCCHSCMVTHPDKVISIIHLMMIIILFRDDDPPSREKVIVRLLYKSFALQISKRNYVTKADYNGTIKANFAVKK
jgi:hypothetical protein